MQCIRTIGAAGIAQLSSHDSNSGADTGHVARHMSQLLHDTMWDRSMGQILTPEQLVGVGFRGWMAGYEYSDISCWEQVWNRYACALGPKAAKLTISELGGMML